MYLLAQDTLNGAEGKITVTRDGRITEICGIEKQSRLWLAFRPRT